MGRRTQGWQWLLVTALASYLNQTVYVIYSKTGDVDREWSPFVVRDNRNIG